VKAIVGSVTKYTVTEYIPDGRLKAEMPVSDDITIEPIVIPNALF